MIVAKRIGWGEAAQHVPGPPIMAFASTFLARLGPTNALALQFICIDASTPRSRCRARVIRVTTDAWRLS